MSRAKTAARAAEEVSAEPGAVNANTAEGDPGRGFGGSAAHDSAEDKPAAEPGSATPTEPSAAEADPTGADPADPDSAATPTEAEPEAAETEAEVTPAKPRPVWRRLPALLAAAVVLAGAGVWFTLEARSAASTSAAANLALTDVGATADVSSAVSLAVNRIFSYSYNRTDVTEKAAAAVLRGSAKDSYDKLFAEVKRKAPEQKLVLTSRVSAVAVQELKNDHARLLVFLDQSAVRADNNAADSAAAQLSVTAEHSTGGWVITALEPR
jgi:Mce-associated membrane protein